MQKSEQLTVEG